jgi:hypothetical protein
MDSPIAEEFDNVAVHEFGEYLEYTKVAHMVHLEA